MNTKHKADIKNAPIIKGVLGGVISCVAVSLIFAALAAALIAKGNAAESTAKYFAIVTILLSAFIGTLIAWKMAGRKPAQICGLVTCVYCFMLVCANVFAFDGVFTNVGLSVLMILLGGAGTCLIAMKKGTKRKTKRRHFR